MRGDKHPSCFSPVEGKDDPSHSAECFHNIDR
jgi:hypothetical protein